MRNRIVVWTSVFLVGCTLFPTEEYRYLPDHDDAALLRDYAYVSHTATSIEYQVQVSALAWYNSDLTYFEDEFEFTGDGTFEVLDFAIESTNLAGNSSTVLLIDQSGSYLEIDPFNNRTKAINKFLEDIAPPNDFRVGGFSMSGALVTEPVEYSSHNFNSSWTDAEFLFELAGRTGGVSPLYDAIDDALNTLSTSSKMNRNLIVMVHAMNTERSTTLADIILKATLNSVKIHVVIFGTQPEPTEVWSLAEQTNGMLALCSTDSDLITVFNNLDRLLNIYTSVNKLTIRFTPAAGNVVSGNEYENRIKLRDSYSGYEFNPVYVKVKIP